jgi:hypothetical protein
MMLLTATWSLGYAALVIGVILLSYRLLYRRHRQSDPLAAQALLVIGTVLLWTSLAIRFIRGRGWPFQSPEDLASGMALLLLLFYVAWSLASGQRRAALFVAAIALLLLSYALIRQPPTFSTQPYPSPGVRTGTVLNLAGGALLALAAATSLASLVDPPNAQPPASQPANYDQASEAFVRGALFCLAASLALDTWWLQKVGLGNIKNAQQAGIAVTWMVYFVAVRLRTQPDWKGWPWTALVTVGFACALPILLNVPWLETTLSL